MISIVLSCSPNVNTDSPLVNQPIPTHTFTGSSNTTYQTDVNVFSTKAGLHNVCTHIGYGMNHKWTKD